MSLGAHGKGQKKAQAGAPGKCDAKGQKNAQAEMTKADVCSVRKIR